MTPERRAGIAKEVLFFMLRNNEELAVKLDGKAGEIARARGIPEEEIREVLYPFLQAALRERGP